MEEARCNFEESVIRQRAMQALNRGAKVYTDGDADAVPEGGRLITWETLLANDLLAGPPDHVIEQIEKLREVVGITNLITFMDAGGVSHDKIMKSIELFGTRVMPAL